MDIAYKPKDMKVEVIHTTVGSREHYEDGRVVYNSAPYEDGWCYKDDKAWDTNGICYIPEAEFEYASHIDDKEVSGFCKEDIKQALKEALDELELPYSQDFIENKSKAVYDVAQWETIGVIIDRVDWEEELNEFNLKEDLNA